MKNLLLLLITLCTTALYGQRFGYVDTEYVLNSLPQYAEAQQNLNAQAGNWSQEIQNHQASLENMLSEFQAEKILLTKEQVSEREKQIENQRKLISDLQEKRYGPQGDLIAIRRNLVKPIQDQIWNAVKTVAERRNYSFIFDKGSDLVMLYSDPKFDVSEEVLRMVLPQGKEPVRNVPRTQNNTVNPLTDQKRDIKKIDNRIKVQSERPTEIMREKK
ncbi:MAG: OmpH family outer membrane protein [Flavobacteriaceae bacterium]|nr:OmpH family outer membrane protein [Flavobacteriaceae bacterium]